jgi:DNA-binding phage protein
MRQFRPKCVAVPKKAHPLVIELFEEMNRQRIGLADLADRSGIGRDAISAWRYRQSPSLAGIDACLNVLGLQLCTKKIS